MQKTEKLLKMDSLQANQLTHMEIQRGGDSQNNPKKEQSWRTHTSQFQNLL